jgi:hypothetical protein
VAGVDSAIDVSNAAQVARAARVEKKTAAMVGEQEVESQRKTEIRTKQRQ